MGILLCRRSFTQILRLGACTRDQASCRFPGMLWSILVLLLIFWALGFGFHVAGGLIHLLLVVALVVLIVQLITGRRV